MCFEPMQNLLFCEFEVKKETIYPKNVFINPKKHEIATGNKILEIPKNKSIESF